jgi:hypothetical protein
MDTLMKKALLATCGTVALTSVAFAQPPMPNVFDGGSMWQIIDYLDEANDHRQLATQNICFLPYAVVGNSIQGVWYSTTYNDWNGMYYQEGDELRMTGDFWDDTGHDHMTLLHTTFDVPGEVKGLAFKDWDEWIEDGEYGKIGQWGNAKMERIGKCEIQKAAVAIEYSRQLPPRLTIKGDVARMPTQADLESVEEYLMRNGLK